MSIGFYLVQGDKTTCGGRIIEGATDHTIFGKAAAREKDRVLCGKHPGTFLIAGGIVNDTIHGRRMAGTLDSESTCPCKAKFIPSMLQDTYEKGGEASESSSSLDGLMIGLQKPYEALHQEDNVEHNCFHTDGAIQVAKYLLNEIKVNAKSEIADRIRYFIDDEMLRQRFAEWNNLPFYAKLSSPPQPNLIAAMGIWYQTVKTKSTWDHKPKIRDKFGSVAVARPLPAPSNAYSESYFHKYKGYDYFYDVWSNIHYGYIGLSVGFSESLLLKGSTWEQNMTLGAMGNDTLDDVTSMKLGFELFHKYGKYAENLTAEHILDALHNTPNKLIQVSKQKHWCWNSKNPEHIDEPK
ncbi:polymorphic toxin type 44 domain-containing protein [Pantoea sp. S18]|uniref:polymorphic toxin type 44 domain-containing protein n=1 Tax=Pantoea sp. S18 TaxID=3019892 RepID=UPI002B21F16C|nr:polymorphic toxin type 44 domain-containing protein [Pantoea sp. S18]MEA5103945.1 polymorphic toxin type 44 domain-containing protein [Pantoea sp. S18]